MIVKTIFNKDATQLYDTGGVFSVNMPKSNRGIFSVKRTSVGNASIQVKLQGRLSSDMEFIDVANASVTLTSSAAVKTDSVEDIQLYPEMQALVSSFSGGVDTPLIVQLGC